MSPRRCLTALILAFSLSIVGLAPLASGSSGLDARDMEQAVADVSGERMMSTIRDLEAFGSRAFYLPSSLDAAAYIYDRLEQLGLYVTYQYFSVQDFAAVNVVATLNGTSEGAPQYLFGAHFDSENMFADTYSEGENYSAPGADDDASGVAAVIELATLMAGMEFENTVKFVAFDAEEYGFDQIGGLKGSAHFASVEKAAKARYAGTAILDMIGWKQGSDNVAFGIVNVDNDRMAMATEDSVERFGIDLTFT
ncbi:MAG: hypothetical protein A3K67_01910 [Euryarchaeota archaeon RBG_16_62_10]|nr:MAG: hypothetical protein A3K67_01910 [Euryarchaeota archaeon RBG_16_62_10]